MARRPLIGLPAPSPRGGEGQNRSRLVSPSPPGGEGGPQGRMRGKPLMPFGECHAAASRKAPITASAAPIASGVPTVIQ
jgi:hypothetical protein